jgi:hypothetical protein
LSAEESNPIVPVSARAEIDRSPQVTGSQALFVYIRDNFNPQILNKPATSRLSSRV